jgi:hypothetical protein
MENAVDALKIAFAVMMFVMALTLSISSFSMARSATEAIINLRDRESEYTYVEPSENLTRTVGIETVVSTMYRIYVENENIEIYFVKSDGKTPFALYYDTDTSGKIKKDENGNKIEISHIELSEGFADAKDAKQHLDIILGGESQLEDKSEKIKEEYKNKLIYKDGLYNYLKDVQFEEMLGEYYQSVGASQTKKRVITYRLQNL